MVSWRSSTSHSMLRRALQSSLSVQVRSAAVAGMDSSSLRRWYSPRSFVRAFTTSLERGQRRVS